jgi:hypothetical protein
MYSSLKHYYVAVFVFVAVASPLWARTDKQLFSLDHSAVIGSTQLKPGAYELMANEGKKDLMVVQNGKIITDVPGSWVQLPKKAEYSEVVLNGDRITQIEFDGRAQAFQLR